VQFPSIGECAYTPGFFISNGLARQVAGEFVQWGYRDASIWCPLVYETLKGFNQDVFNLEWHMKESKNDIMSWPSSVRKDTWKQYLAQVEFEKKEAKKKRKSA